MENISFSKNDFQNKKKKQLDHKIDLYCREVKTIVDEIKTLKENLDFPVKEIEKGINFDQEIINFKVDLINSALVKTGGNQKTAASLLNLNLATLNHNIKKYSIKIDKKGKKVENF